jgi:SAM-dependent methyltransferase
VLTHAGALAIRRRQERIATVMSRAAGRDVLELGSQGWVNFLERPGIHPARLCCINIAESELARGRRLAVGSRLRPAFALMDAMNLAFGDASFDVVFGSSILHHLDLEPALEEIRRVLRPGGMIVFSEPLGTNPVGKVVRWLTPHARTADERPFSLADLRALRRRFDVELVYEQLLTVPAGLVSRLVFGNPDNRLMRLALRADEVLARRVAPAGPLFRRVLIVGRRRGSAR